jgi:hypothetical protein
LLASGLLASGLLASGLLASCLLASGLLASNLLASCSSRGHHACFSIGDTDDRPVRDDRHALTETTGLRRFELSGARDR